MLSQYALSGQALGDEQRGRRWIHGRNFHSGCGHSHLVSPHEREPYDRINRGVQAASGIRWEQDEPHSQPKPW